MAGHKNPTTQRVERIGWLVFAVGVAMAAAGIHWSDELAEVVQPDEMTLTSAGELVGLCGLTFVAVAKRFKAWDLELEAFLERSRNAPATGPKPRPNRAGIVINVLDAAVVIASLAAVVALSSWEPNWTTAFLMLAGALEKGVEWLTERARARFGA